MVVSARSFYSGKPVHLRDAMISGLLSPTDNPHGYWIASTGTASCGILLLPVALVFYRKLAPLNRPLAMSGAFLFGLGPLAATSMIFVAAEINDLHVYLAFGAYIFMTTGLTICLALESSALIMRRGIAGKGLLSLILFLLAVLIFLVYLLFTPDFFDDRSLLGNVAFCEWALCCIIAACISGLAVMVSRPTR